MAVTNGYTTVEAVKARLNDRTSSSDAILEAVITAASRAIDDRCGRVFYTVVAEARVFTPCDGGWLSVPDLLSVSEIASDPTGLRSYGDIWQPGDYDLLPVEAAYRGEPYDAIALAPYSTKYFPRLPKGVRITGDWGWSAPPAPIAEATILQSIRLLKRKDAPFGIAGSPELGQMLLIGKMDPDVKTLIEPYRRFAIGAV